MVNNAVLQFTDRAFLAHESMASLEAALPASMLAFIVLGFFQSVVAYSGTFVAQFYGAGDLVRCRASFRAGTALAVLSGLLALAAVPLGDWVFETLSRGADVIARQEAYYTICTAGGVFLFGQRAAQSYFTGLGLTRIVFWVNLVGNLFNVALDPFLIFGWCGLPKLGIAGAAYATVAATALQWLILSVAVRRHDRKAPVPPSTSTSTLHLLLRILRFGIPSGAYSILNIVSFTIFVFVTAGVGHVEQAVSNAAFSVCYLLFAPMEGFALGAQTLVGQCRGRGDDAEAMRTGLRAAAIGAVLAIVLSLLALVLCHPILSLFAPDDPSVTARFHELGGTLFLLMAAWQVFDATDIIISGALKGAGDTTFVMVLMVVTAFGFWLPLVWCVARWHNTMAALWSTMILFVAVLCAGSLLRWLRGRWKRLKVI